MNTPPNRRLTVAVVGTYPPRACGIATFTRDLVEGLAGLWPPVAARVVAIDGAGERFAYAPIVAAEVDEGDPASYVAAAERLGHLPDVDAVSIQHDFGKFGVWRDGFREDYLAPMLRALRAPVAITLHSVPAQPNELMRRTIREAGVRAKALVVMAEAARPLLRDAYELDNATMAKVVLIPHGVPREATALPPREEAKAALGLSGRRILGTFGLLGEGKGIEDAIRALPPLVAAYPNLCYLVVGRTHPDLAKREGERYREGLKALSRELRVEGHVLFVDRFVSESELLGYLAATDVYVTPYPAPDQITSGTLAYAVACGRAVVSTPYPYARELLADGRGLLARFRDPSSLAHAVAQLLGNPLLRHELEARAAAHGRAMTWDRVAARYRDLFASLLGARPSEAASDLAPSGGAGTPRRELSAARRG